MIRVVDQQSHSSDVEMRLDFDGKTFEVASTLPDRLRLRNAAAAPRGNGRLIISIDGRETIDEVRLPDGIDASQVDTPYEMV